MNHLIRLCLLVGCVLGFARLASAETKTPGDVKKQVLSSYVKVSTALAADDLAAAKKAGGELAQVANRSKDLQPIGARAGALAQAAKIEDARKNFLTLSAAVEPLANGESNYIVMHCPMAGDWVQEKGPTRNPYMGKAMLTCGGPKETK